MSQNYFQRSHEKFPKMTDLKCPMKFSQNIFSGMTIDAVNEKFHHSDHCWVVDEQDVLMLMANL